MTTPTSTQLAEAAVRLRHVEQELSGPGPLFQPLRFAQRAEVWKGTLADTFVAELEHKDRFLKQRLAPAVGTVAAYSERQAQALADHERAVAAGAAEPAPVPPAVFATGGPGSLDGFTPHRGPASDYAAMDPARVRELCSLIGGAVDALYVNGRVVNDVVSGLAPLFPADAMEASGRDAFLRLCDWLKDAMVDLNQRARRIELSYAAGALFGAATPSIDELMATLAAIGTPAAMGIRKRAVRPTSEGAGEPAMDRAQLIVAATAAAQALANLARHGDDDDVKRALESLQDGAAYANPAYAAAVVNALGVKGLRDLRVKERFYGEQEDAYLCSLGTLVADASRSRDLDPQVLDDLVHPDNEMVLAAVTRCGTWNPDHAYRVATAFIDRDPSLWAGLPGLGAHGLEVLARHPDAAARFVTEHGHELTGRMMLHLKDMPDLSSEVGRVLLAALETNSAETLDRTTKTYEKVLRSIGAGQRHSKETRLAAAGFIATRIDALVDLNGSASDSYKGLTLKGRKLSACLAELAKDPDAWAVVTGSISVDLHRRARAWVGEIAEQLSRQPDLMTAAGFVADRTVEDLSVGIMLGTMYRAVVEAHDDAKAAAAITASILQMTASAALSLVPVAGAAGAGLAMKGLGELGRQVTGEGVERAAAEAAEVMTSTEGRRPVPAELRRFVEPHVRNVLAVSLYNNEATRAELMEMGMTAPPPCSLQDGVLMVPSGKDKDCYQQFNNWFAPADATKTNPLFTVAARFIQSPDGLMHEFESTVLDTTAARTD